MEPLRRGRGGGRREERMLWSSVNRLCDERPRGLAQEIFLGHSSYFQRNRHAAKEFDHVMIQERHPPFNGVSHLHAVTQKIQNITRQERLGPDEERFVQWVAPIQDPRDIEAIEEKAGIIPMLELVSEFFDEESSALIASLFPNLEASRYKPYLPLPAGQCFCVALWQQQTT